MRALARLSLLLALTMGLPPARPALAAWPYQPSVNLKLCNAANNQQDATIVSDGAGGAIVTWQDFRSGSPDIYAQHVLASGVVDPAWTANGTVVCNAADDQRVPTITSDGAGGAIVTWYDLRSGTSLDIYAQHVLASGVVDPAWPANGTLLCNAAINQEVPTIVSDGAGGAIVTWRDIRNGTNYDIYAQHVLASGVVDPAWAANGTLLCNAANHQYDPTIVSDGAGGAIVTWYDLRSGSGDIYAQHVRAAGSVDPTWTANGTQLCGAANEQGYPQIVSDGTGGAIVSWSDYRSVTSGDIYAQHVLAAGGVDPAWTFNGTLLCGAANDQSLPTIVSDGTGGAIVTWQDYRSGMSNDIYAQHVLAAGGVDPAWTANGTLLCNATDIQFGPTIVSDGAGGAIVTWYDFRSGSYDIYAQHVLAAGGVDPAWIANGNLLSSAANYQYYPRIVSDGAGGAIVSWQDTRTNSLDIYAQRVARFGYLGTPEAEIVSVNDVPNDNGGKVKLSWNASYLDLNSDLNLSSYDILRSAPPNAVAEARARRSRMVPLGMGTPLPGELVVTTNGAQSFYWEFLASVTALHYLSGYSYLAPTTGDSIAAGNPPTAFMVVARNAAVTKFWPSQPKSGYSVDNLPPVPPAPFTGEYSVGVAHLHWNPNVESDLANYRLYRGTTVGFIPSPANRIASPADTGYTDSAGAAFYYKLSAVDVHGNESGFATLLPGVVLDAPVGTVPRAVALSNALPNPVRNGAEFRFALPREGRVSLTLFDQQGRRVRELVSGVVPAGDHVASWDGRDRTGRKVPTGLYFIRLEAHGRTLNQRFAAIH